MIGQTQTAAGSRALVQGLQTPGPSIDVGLCAGNTACETFIQELPTNNFKDWTYGTIDRPPQILQEIRLRALAQQIREGSPNLSDDEILQKAARRLGIYDAARLVQAVSAASRGLGASEAEALATKTANTKSAAVSADRGVSVSVDGHKIYDPAYPAMSTNPKETYRFSDPTYRSTGGDVYFGENLATAYLEVRQNITGKSLFVGQVEVGNMLDLTDPAVLKSMSIDSSKVSAIASDVDAVAKSSVYSYTNQIANQAFDAGYTGIIYSSTRNPSGKAVVLFGGRFDPNAIQPIIDIRLKTNQGNP